MQKYIIKPIAVWLCILITIMNSIMIVNYKSNMSEYYLILSIIFVLMAVKNLITNRRVYLAQNKKYIIVMVLVIIFNNFITYFTAYNIHVVDYFKFYILHLTFIFYLVTDNNTIFSRIGYDSKYYDRAIIFFVVINVLACIAIFYGNTTFIKFIQGEYSEIFRFTRYGAYQYSGMFAWPNHLGYVSLALYLLTLYIPTSFVARTSLFITSILSVNRVSIGAMVIVFIFIERKRLLRIIKNKKIFAMVITIFICIIVTIIFLNRHKIEFIFQSIVNELFSPNKNTYRRTKIEEAYQIFSQNPIIGVGLRRVGEIGLALSLNDYIITNQLAINEMIGTTDTFLTVYSEIGIIGTTLLLIIAIKIFISRNFRIKLVLLAIIIICYSLYNPFSLIFTMWIYGIIFAYYLREYN